jgi:hypothetical protein
MTNDPISILGAHPSGALPRRPDVRDYPFSPLEIAEATAPFNWQTGYDVEADLVAKLTVKDQGQSGSCGGQAFAAYGQALRIAYAKDAAERSAKFLYSQVYVPVPGGGSSDRELARIAQGQGFGLEKDVSSYMGGNPPVTPTEAFMERAQDITGLARIDAAKDKISFAYAFPTINLDSVAQACAASKGIVLGLRGSNNGTWLDVSPKPPSYAPAGLTNSPWSHYVYGGKPKIYNGKKGIWILNSWGVDVGIGGWQFLDEDYFASGAVWGAIVLIYNPSPSARPTHSFMRNIPMGEQSAEVLALQQVLAYDGEFNLAPTGYFGSITAQAVLKYQIKNVVADATTLAELGGHNVGPATRKVLNAQYGS